MNISDLKNYYRQCLREEATIASFTNLKKNDSVVIKLKGREKLFHEFPNPVQPQEETAELTQLYLKNNMSNKNQLVYGYMFITGTLSNGTEIYTPLLIADCELERIMGKIAVSIKEETLSFNMPALPLLSSSNNVSAVFDFIVPSLPLTEESIKGIEEYLSNCYSDLDVTGSGDKNIHLNREHAIISTTIQKGLAGVIKELDGISTSTCAGTALSAVINDLPKDKSEALEKFYPVDNTISMEEPMMSHFSVIDVDKSQFDALSKSVEDTITAITGAPGTGKSNTIAAIAVDYIMNGKTVLIASKSNTAVDVLYNKLQGLSEKPFCVRAGSKEHRKELSKMIEDITTGKLREVPNAIGNKKNALNTIYEYTDQIERAQALIQEKNRLVTELNSISSNGNLLSHIKTFFERQTILSEIHDYENELATYPLNSIQPVLQAMIKDAMYYKACIDIETAFTDNTIRRELMLLGKFIKRNQPLPTVVEQTYRTLINSVLPCWFTTVVDVSESVPFLAGLFDVVIIDEASQCDIATCLPLLYRAKKAVVVGDDKQLKFLSFLNNSLNETFMNTNNLGKYSVICDYKNNSMFDFAGYFSEGNVTLSYQYRGTPALMDFSNKTFYNGVITNMNTDKDFEQVSVVNIENGKVMSGKSQNNAEAAAVLEEIKKIVSDNINNAVKPTIGVLSPFREQCKLLEKMILNVFTTDEIKQHKITVGTAHSFQGEERDIMLLSWVVAPNSPVQSFTFINNPNLFNVAVTRANQRVVNYISTPVQNLPQGLLRQYMEYCLAVQEEHVRKLSIV